MCGRIKLCHTRLMRRGLVNVHRLTGASWMKAMSFAANSSRRSARPTLLDLAENRIRFDDRWGAGDADRIRQYAAELVALAPEVIFASGAAAVAQVLQATRTIPIVFAIVPDPVGAGFVDSLA